MLLQPSLLALESMRYCVPSMHSLSRVDPSRQHRRRRDSQQLDSRLRSPRHLHGPCSLLSCHLGH
ncbi:hypothetical protein QC762_603710 [Podospora pseudocomata]|uniref:Uncharacterized protein n=1 Tax=Podospora pseudocomata TaxID=2093779 RepID=A0ABR0G679_9PEZI|nr:hypothetical protein QC762_603710 [Podospora pseudocomata]